MSPTALERDPRLAPKTPKPKPVLEVSDLSIVYDDSVKAVDHVSLSLMAGETVGLAGESGCGKSTFALGLCRLLRPPAVITSGSVVYRGSRIGPEGIELLDKSSRELRKLRWREISVVFQSAMNALNPVLRVRDQLADALNAHLRLSRSERAERLHTLVDLVGIPRERLRSYPHELSGGMRQRVMIAMALAAEPEVVIMDEPTTALDVVVQREILAQVVELQSQLGFAVLFITHDLSLLLEIADRIAVMYAGKLVEIASAEDIRRGAAHPYTQGLLASFPSVHGPRRELVGIPGSPPDLRGELTGCPFVPRCVHASEPCRDVDMRLEPVPGSDADHVSACPFVGPAAAQASASARRSRKSPAIRRPT